MKKRTMNGAILVFRVGAPKTCAVPHNSKGARKFFTKYFSKTNYVSSDIFLVFAKNLVRKLV